MIVDCYISLLSPAPAEHKSIYHNVQFPEWRAWHIRREHSFNDRKQTAFSHLLVCPSCYRIWAKIIFERDQLCWPKAQFCERCPIVEEPWHPVPGSLLLQEGWDVIDESLVVALPLELLQREFELHIKALGINPNERSTISSNTISSGSSSGIEFAVGS